MKYFKYIPNGAPKFEPDKYIGSDWNCVAYALRLYDHGYATPGELTSVNHVELSPEHRTAQEIERRLTEIDKLERVRLHGTSRNDHVIGVRVLPTFDFHAVSIDDDGLASEKLGEMNVQRTEIPNPADKFFVGFFKVPEAGIKYYPRLKEIKDWRALGLDI